MNFFKTSILAGIKTIVTMTLGLLTNKFLALFIGSEGFAVVGQLKDFLKIGLSIGQLGFDRGIVKYTAEFKDTPEKLKKYLSTIFKSQLVLSTVIAILVIIFKDFLSYYLADLSNYNNYFVLLGLSIVPMVLFTSGMSVLNGLHDIKRFTYIAIIANILGSGSALMLIYYFGLTGVIINLALIQIYNILVFLGFVVVKPFKLDWFKEKIQKREFNQLTKYSIMSIVGTLTLSLTLIAIRKYLNYQFSIEYAGYWEALWRLSMIFVTVLTSAFGFYLLPTFSKLNARHLKKEIFKIWKITIPISIISGVLLIILRDLAINLVYTEEFLIISGLMVFQICGDIIKINSWVLGNLILAKTYVKTYVTVQIGWSLIFFTLSILFTQKYGFVGIAIAYLISYIIHFLFMNIYFRKLLWQKSIRV